MDWCFMDWLIHCLLFVFILLLFILTCAAGRRESPNTILLHTHYLQWQIKGLMSCFCYLRFFNVDASFLHSNVCLKNNWDIFYDWYAKKKQHTENMWLWTMYCIYIWIVKAWVCLALWPAAVLQHKSDKDTPEKLLTKQLLKHTVTIVTLCFKNVKTVKIPSIVWSWDVPTMNLPDV